jgi:hypothetical protein
MLPPLICSSALFTYNEISVRSTQIALTQPS